MKRTKLTCIILMLATSVFAQDSISLTKFYFGANLSSYIQQDNRPTLVLSYNIKNNHFARLQVGYSTVSGNIETDLDATNSQNNNLNGDTSITNSPYSSQSAAIQLGYYRTTALDKKFSIYYGIDFLFQQDNDFSEINLKTRREFSQQQVQFFDTREKLDTKRLAFGVAPMFGIQYQVANRIQVGYEMHLSVLSNDYEQKVNRTTIQTSSFDPRIFESTVKGNKSWNEVTNQFNPMSGLFISYRL